MEKRTKSFRSRRERCEKGPCISSGGYLRGRRVCWWMTESLQCHTEQAGLEPQRVRHHRLPSVYLLPIQILIITIGFHLGSIFYMSGTTFLSSFYRWGSGILKPCFSTFFYVLAHTENNICKAVQSWQQLPSGLRGVSTLAHLELPPNHSHWVVKL